MHNSVYFRKYNHSWIFSWFSFCPITSPEAVSFPTSLFHSLPLSNGPLSNADRPHLSERCACDAHERSSSGWLDCYPCQTSVMMLCFVRCRSLGNHPLLIISSVLLLGLRCDLGGEGNEAWGQGGWGDPYWPWPCAHQESKVRLAGGSCV